MPQRHSKDYDRYNINIPRKHVKKSSRKPVYDNKGKVKGHRTKYKYKWTRRKLDGTKLKKSGTHRVRSKYPKAIRK